MKWRLENEVSVKGLIKHKFPRNQNVKTRMFKAELIQVHIIMF